VSGFDTLYIYGTLRNFDSWQRIVNLKRQGVRFVYTHDDSIWHHPEWRTDQPEPWHVSSVNLACELADLIVASTTKLAEVIGKPDKTVTCPNLMEVAGYQTPTPPQDDDRIRICWAGGGGHWADLQLVDEACCRIKEKWGQKVEFHFLGYGPDKLLRDHLGDGVHLTDWYPLIEHRYRLHTIRPHIVLAPLVPCTFNEVKSNIRVLEGWSLNAAVIASPVGEYEKVIRHCENALYAYDENDWFQKMDYLISTRRDREALALNGWSRVNEEWNWGNPTCRKKWSPVIEWLDACK
jgi:glycosyltransferase involved in cell wall biosynthesis